MAYVCVRKLLIMKYSLICLLLTLASAATAQHNNEFYNDGALVHVQAGAEVHVWGDVHMYQATGDLENNGLIKTQGNSYSDALYQQSGTGAYRVENSDVNIGERQFISGSYAVRGGQAATGVNDGSFYDLQLSNDQGIVYLVGAGNIADVRNSVDYWYGGGVYNRILTHDVGMTGAIIPPVNGSSYTGVFGLMNPTAGFGDMTNNTVSLNGNMSGTDWGYVQGKFRRAISPAGGQYQYVLGLEPAGAGAQRGMQYMRLDFAANNYDVIQGYFESGSSNVATIGPECSGYLIDYFGGLDHGEWMFDDITGTGAGVYTGWVWPQDDNFPLGTVWIVTKDNSFQGTPDDCGPSPVGLSRAGFNGFSEFGLASGTVIALPIELLDINATGMEEHIDVVWNVSSEYNVSHYELERSEDGTSFEYVTSILAMGTTIDQQTYAYADRDVRFFQNYYYRVNSIDKDGFSEYTPTVVASIENFSGSFGEEMVSVYPNPSNDDFALSIHSDESRELTMKVFNSVGQLIQENTSKIANGNTVIKIAADQWSSGLYLLEIVDINSGQTINKKLVKK
ncbi:MAG: hypothetical protein ACI865_003101 [Flavobacteriaceae bacterium]|jgi:hypothetical protein